jgi:hypothetical protein
MSPTNFAPKIPYIAHNLHKPNVIQLAMFAMFFNEHWIANANDTLSKT